ncbi:MULTISPECIES: PHP domain-containing protein [unclassified Haladaptatus]|uniref:PHP domain-containing protein n=1 Tax=unclassified Haladaptatus TaxID=2622732 RepID=UPI0023E8C6FA|nr:MULTISPECIES: PHP domain-containing protein [unclassified Haladaptatus]
MLHDYHVHSNYSDGRFLFQMLQSAEQAGLKGVGFADHCNVSDRERMQDLKHLLGFNLDQTYDRRLRAIRSLSRQFDIEIYNAVEMDYDPDDHGAIRNFFNQTDFDYTIGSVHHLEEVNVHIESYFAKKSEAERRKLVDEYFEKLVSLAQSELFDIAAHVDLLERNPAFRDLATDDHYHAAARAFKRSRTVPEINAGRVLTDYGKFHPVPRFLDVLLEHEVRFTVGSDSHRPEEIAPRVKKLREFFEEQELDPLYVV